MQVRSVDHIELFVADAEAAAARLRDSFGFALAGRGGSDTGLRGCTSVLLRQRDITLLLTEALERGHRAAEYVAAHGDGVAVIGLAVDDAHAAFAEAVERGAAPVMPPEVSGPFGARVTFASVMGFGDVEHRFVSRERPGASFAPVIEEVGCGRTGGGHLTTVDHFAVCVPAGELDATVRHFTGVFGFVETFGERSTAESQAVESTVVRSPSGDVTFTILEPDVTRDAGQVDAFALAHGGARVQHVAFRTPDITAAVRASEDRGVRFLDTPAGHYDAPPGRLGPIGVPGAEPRELNVLPDRDPDGVMLRIFTESAHPRRTLFYELVDRRGARTCGGNHVRALYEAVERQPAPSGWSEAG